MPQLKIRVATENDCAVILSHIRALAEFEKLAHDVLATETSLRATLFAPKAPAEVLLAELHETDDAGKSTIINAGFALFFTSYSTFLAKPGIYLEDLFIPPELRSHGIGKKLLQRLARLALERDCGRLEWSVLDWNQRALDFYARLGAKPMSEWTVQRLAGAALNELANERLT